MIFRRKQEPAVELPAPIVRISTPKEAGEHDELEALHIALSTQKRARELAVYAERVETDAMRALDEARKGMRRVAEQR